MDLSSSSIDGKKVSLEDLPKEELIKKYRSLLTIAQKAKQAKDFLTEENTKLKEQQKASQNDDIIEALTQQKLSLATNLEELKLQRKKLDEKLLLCEEKINSSEKVIADLDTQNQSYNRQIVRLTDENEQLITHLDGLEKQIEELKKIGLVQQQQLLTLEKNNSESLSNSEKDGAVVELQNMLSVSLEEVKKLKVENETVIKDCESSKLKLQENENVISSLNQELQDKVLEIQNLQTEFANYKSENSSKQEIDLLKAKINESAESIQLYQQEIEAKSKELDKHTSLADDLNTEIHKNRALIQKLKQDITNMSQKLNDNQIISSGLNTDLENTNERLKDKLKSYHAKMVKFAVDVKKLKESKEYILDNFKTYNRQVKSWREQLIIATRKLTKEINESEEERVKLRGEVEDLKLKLSQQGNNESLLEENKELNNKVNNLVLQFDEVKNRLESLQNVHEEEVKVLEGNKLREVAEVEKMLKEKLRLSDEMLVEMTGKLETAENELSELKLKVENSESKLKETSEGNEEEIKILKEKLNEFTKLTQDNIKLVQENDEFKFKLNDLNQKYEKQVKIVEDLKEEKNSLSSKLKCAETEVEESNKLISGLKEAIEHLEKEVAHSKSTETKLAEQSGQEIIKLSQENKKLLEKIELQDIQLQELKEKVNNGDGAEKINALKRENAELLAEMNEMNQALKERGETISQQQAYCDEVLKKISIYEIQANKNVETISQHEETIKLLQDDLKILRSNSGTSEDAEKLQKAMNELKVKDLELEQLRSEIVSLKDRLASNLDASQDGGDCDTLSTSTISRSEEVNRLKDLEGSWEERYGKLRSLALKLKGKIKELTAELGKEQAEKGELQHKLSNSIKSVQSLQAQCDKVQDELDAFKSENKSLIKKLDSIAVDVSKDKKQLAMNEEFVTKLKAEIENLNKDKANVDAWKKQVSVKVQSLKKELEANALLKKDFEAKIQKLTNDLESKEKSLKEEKERHLQTKNSLQESNNECKKQSVLNLEMQDYEKGIKELTQKLEKKNELVTKLKNQIDSQKSTVNAVKEQNRLMEEKSNSFETEIGAYRIEINTFKKNISELESLLSEKEIKIQEVVKSLENSRAENEELSTQLSKIIAEHQKHNNQLKDEKDHLRSQNIGFEQKLREVEDRLKLREEELSNIQNEYKGYKVRAQSVLRQNQARDVGMEEKLTEEAESLKAQVDILRAEIRETKSSLDQTVQENNKLTRENERLETTRLELTNEMEECRKEYEKLNSKYSQTISDHAETIRSLKLNADTLAQCYRQQISEQEVRHNREIIELQSKLEKGSSPPDIPSLIIPTTPREEGEGSESVDSSNGNIHPLEKLLGTDQEQEISFIKKQLNENESKVVHLTALLADTEQDLAKHVQMNKVLKEEIRRQQRSVEREKHAENLEYMKNVVFKFITLSNGDERQRLIPVLNTILKLSPEETQKLNMVAKGDKSWSNYLPIWSKPQ